MSLRAVVGFLSLVTFRDHLHKKHPQSDLVLILMKLQEAGGWPRNLQRSFSNVFSMILQF